jgi:hypothetical protein
MDTNASDRLKKIRSNYDALASAYAREISGRTPGGHVLLGVHVGTEVVHVNELWGVPVDFDAAFFDLHELIGKLETQGVRVIETVQREPHPEIEHQSVRGYIWAQRAAG